MSRKDAAVAAYDHAALIAALSTIPCRPGQLSVLIAHTIEGKGVSFMENRIE